MKNLQKTCWTFVDITLTLKRKTFENLLRGIQLIAL